MTSLSDQCGLDRRCPNGWRRVELAPSPDYEYGSHDYRTALEIRQSEKAIGQLCMIRYQGPSTESRVVLSSVRLHRYNQPRRPCLLNPPSASIILQALY